MQYCVYEYVFFCIAKHGLCVFDSEFLWDRLYCRSKDALLNVSDAYFLVL